MRGARLRAMIVTLAGVVMLLAGCIGGGPPAMAGTLTVYASPSLSEAIQGMVAAYTGTYPGIRIDTVFEPDSQLAQRVRNGETPDLLAVEDETTLTDAGITAEPVHFASGQLVLAVRAGNPALIGGLADLARPDLRVALCATQEPCGRATEALLASAQVTVPDGVSRETDVRAALRRVIDGTADAAIVLRTGALLASPDVATIELPGASTTQLHFVAVVPGNAPQAGLAQGFLDYLTSEPVATALSRMGFRIPG